MTDLRSFASALEAYNKAIAAAEVAKKEAVRRADHDFYEATRTAKDLLDR